MLVRFKNNDDAYITWLNEHENDGYVFNFFKGTNKQANMYKLHIAHCRHLRRACDEGKRTITYEKVCSDNLEEIVEFIIQERGEYWEPCKDCKLSLENRGLKAIVIKRLANYKF